MYVRFGKRILDILIGIIAMPILLILIVIFGPAIWLEDRGPIFYNAPRMGKDYVPYKMYKFRSMKVNAPDLVMEDGSTYNGADDPRMTRVGAFMRRTSLDEFPQFLNVLIGNMSVIGPRPDLERETLLYQGNEGEKLTVKPGITGYAAVYGRNAIPWHDRLKMDVYYVHHISFRLDAKIFFRTFSTIFSQEGIYVENGESAGKAATDDAGQPGSADMAGCSAEAEAAARDAVESKDASSAAQADAPADRAAMNTTAPR
ncbi:MAG: sugar transferase [Eggerthellaceae bacterium]|jgi:undecaprenyl phosphate N,N'-diacetylbacillosamine 1-phosphate transferase